MVMEIPITSGCSYQASITQGEGLVAPDFYNFKPFLKQFLKLLFEPLSLLASVESKG